MNSVCFCCVLRHCGYGVGGASLYGVDVNMWYYNPLTPFNCVCQLEGMVRKGEQKDQLAFLREV